MTIEHRARDQYVTLNNLRFHYREQGRPGSPVLLLLHGMTGNTYQWNSFPDAMADEFHVLALDQRGHGETQWAEDYSQIRMDEDIAAFLQALGISSVNLVGQSLGAINSYLFAARHSRLVARLVIGDFGPDVAASDAAERMATNLRRAPQAKFEDAEEAVAAARISNPRPPGEVQRAVVKGNLVKQDDGKWGWRYDGAGLANWIPSVPAESEQWGLLKSITCPTLLVRGAETEILKKSMAEQMEKEIPNCRLVELPASGHNVPMDNPSAFLAAVRPFLLE